MHSAPIKEELSGLTSWTERTIYSIVVFSLMSSLFDNKDSIFIFPYKGFGMDINFKEKCSINPKGGT